MEPVKNSVFVILRLDRGIQTCPRKKRGTIKILDSRFHGNDGFSLKWQFLYRLNVPIFSGKSENALKMYFRKSTLDCATPEEYSSIGIWGTL